MRMKHSDTKKCRISIPTVITNTLFLFLDLPGWNFLSVCLVWISMRSSSPASAFSSPFWLFFLVPGGPRPPITSLGLGPFFFPGGRPEFWEVVRGALESGEPGNWGPVRPMFCWKMSYQKRKYCLGNKAPKSNSNISIYTKIKTKLKACTNFQWFYYLPQPDESPWPGPLLASEYWWFPESPLHALLKPECREITINHLTQFWLHYRVQNKASSYILNV